MLRIFIVFIVNEALFGKFFKAREKENAKGKYRSILKLNCQLGQSAGVPSVNKTHPVFINLWYGLTTAH